MTRIWLLLGGLNFGFVLWILSSDSQSQNNDTSKVQLQFLPADTLKLTGAPVNVPAPFSAIVKNTSDQEVNIINVNTSCGCTDFEISSRRIPGRGTVTLSGTVRGKPRPETASAHITLEFESTEAQSQKGSAELLLSVEFVSAISISPATISLSPDEYSSALGTGEFRVSNDSDEEVQYDVSAPEFVAISPSVIQLSPGQTQKIEVSVSPDTRQGHGQIRFRNRANGGERTATVVITPKKGVYPESSVLSLGVIRVSKQELTSTHPSRIVLIGGGIGEATISIGKHPDFLSGGIVKYNSDRCVVDFSLDAGTNIHSGRVNGVIELNVEISSGKTHVIRIPVVGRLEDAT